MGTAVRADARPTVANHPVASSWRALGCDVRLVVTDEAQLGPARALLARGLEELDRAASRFRVDSEVTMIASAGGRTVEISPVLADALDVALRAAEQTSGDLDPTVGGDLVHLGYDRDIAELPEDRGWALPIAGGTVAVGRAADWRDVDLDVARRTVRVPAGVLLDLGATAKARAADLAAASIARSGGCGVLVSLGGDIAVAGEPPEGGWVVRVQDVAGDPAEEPAGTPPCMIAIDSGGLATSSTAARRWRFHGSVVHHILDPATARPAPDVWRTVTVAAASCVAANVGSTTAVVRGSDGVPWLRELGLPARLVPSERWRRDGVVLLGGWPQEAQRWTR